MSKHKDGSLSRRTDKERYEAVALYKIVGSLNLVSNTLGIPYDTLRKWHIQDWWKDYELDIIQSSRAKSNTKVKKLAEKAMDIVEDRLDSGDYFYDQKTGKLSRVPIKAEVANRILQDSLTREEMNERLNQDSKKALTEEKMADRLLKIQDSFRAIKMGKNLPQVIEMEETSDAVYEERSPELQGGG